ncbi:hypothetical protein BDF20DRAFT_804539, partial [Mycotypha africana]|uniref:uncharacterized protein n=1 Tax=Mycotypha africana TaxID=64632 RepID=UPI00230093C0
EEQKRILEQNEKIKTQIDASISMARSKVHSWLGSSSLGDASGDDEEVNESILASYSTGRPDRLGLGAKFISHKEAMRHHHGSSENDKSSSSSSSRVSTKQEMMLKNKILRQNSRSHRD